VIALTLAEVAAATHGRVVGGANAGDLTIHDLTADSRSVPHGAAFLALRGDVHDGHDHVRAAVAAGAVAAIVEREDSLGELPGVVVADGQAALAAVAGEVRRRVDAKVVAITGSVGKTTTKDLVAAAVGSQRRVVAARASFNNEVGVPLTLLRLRRDTEVAVVEIGARGRSHIARMIPIIRPDVAVVTAVAGAHLEQFGNLDGVAESKAELVEGLGAGGVAILNADDPLVAAMARRHAGRSVLVSACGNPAADLVAERVTVDECARASFEVVGDGGWIAVRLPIAGVHHVANALLALAAAQAVGVALDAAAAALADATVSAWRSEVVVAGGVVVLNDAYNANVASMLAALDTLAAQQVPGRRWAVLGVMAELGERHHEAAHREVGAASVAAGVDQLVVVGEGASGIAEGARAAGHRAVLQVGTADDAVAALGAVRPGDAVLCKASRVAGLERVAQALVSLHGQGLAT